MREQTIQVPTMQHARVNGVTLEYDVAGQGEPVLLISPVVADGFLPLLAEPSLTRRYQLITYHKRGWAGSTHTLRPVSVEEHAADAAALLAHLGVRRAHIVGHSSGAAVAAQLALLQPELVQTVALLELSLLSVPGAAIFLQKAGPAFDAYAAGNHETALALFMSPRERPGMGGMPNDAGQPCPRFDSRCGPGCRHVLRDRVAGPRSVDVWRRRGGTNTTPGALDARHRD